MPQLEKPGSRCRTRLIAVTAALTICLPWVASGEATRPAIVELYTSQGCSSCPPAEAVIAGFANRSDVIPLAFHVDYWDGLGWRDPFSMKEATRRQEELARTLGLSTVGTPQILVDGRTSFWGTTRENLDKALQAQRQAVPLLLTQKGPILNIRATTTQRYDVYVVGYLPHAVTRIERGENAGRTLTEVNVVRFIRKIGTSGKTGGEWSFQLNSLPNDASRIVVFLQSPDGAIAGVQPFEQETPRAAG